MRENGYPVKEENVANLGEVKTEFNIPYELQSCHTAIVDGYIIEGHVPVKEVERLLTERPDFMGLAVAGMPLGSPGMESAGSDTQPYDVMAMLKSGSTQVFASYQ